MTHQRAYKVRSFTNGKAKDGTEYRHYSLTVPTDIAETLPDGMTFVPSMTDEGILYIPKRESDEKPDLPSWVTGEENEETEEGQDEEQESTKESETA